jgi:hypothetical protein
MNSAPKTEPVADVAATPPNRPSPSANGAPAADPWLMQVPEPGSSDYVLCPPGSYRGAIIHVLDVGHQIDRFNKVNPTAVVHKIILTFELDERRPDGAPFVLSCMYTWSLHDMATFCKLVSAVLNRTFTPKEEFWPNVELPGKTAVVQVTNATSTAASSEGKPYHKIELVTGLIKGMQPYRPVNQLYVYSVVAGDEFRPPIEVPYIFGQSVASVIAASREARARAAQEGNAAPF